MVYFAQTPTGSIKIGTTEDIEARLAWLKHHYGAELALLATIPGGRDEEAGIHARFDHHRIGRTEQFRPGADLMEFIGKPLLVSADPDAVEGAWPHERRLANAVRLDLSDRDHERLDRIARFKGLNMAAYSRMVILDRMRKDEEEMDS
jgi:hypothetical protein